jgi:hypothetical protein
MSIAELEATAMYCPLPPMLNEPLPYFFVAVLILAPLAVTVRA